MTRIVRHKLRLHDAKTNAGMPYYRELYYVQPDAAPQDASSNEFVVNALLVQRSSAARLRYDSDIALRCLIFAVIEGNHLQSLLSDRSNRLYLSFARSSPLPSRTPIRLTLCARTKS